jgi:hypothetical protein
MATALTIDLPLTSIVRRGVAYSSLALFVAEGLAGAILLVPSRTRHLGAGMFVAFLAGLLLLMLVLLGAIGRMEFIP